MKSNILIVIAFIIGVTLGADDIKQQVGFVVNPALQYTDRQDLMKTVNWANETSELNLKIDFNWNTMTIDITNATTSTQDIAEHFCVWGSQLNVTGFNIKTMYKDMVVEKAYCP